MGKCTLAIAFYSGTYFILVVDSKIFVDMAPFLVHQSQCLLAESLKKDALRS
jgi:hypothetical protein